jgi:periplasmic protein TonB
MRFALSGLASLTLHGALLGAALGVAWTGPPVATPLFEVELVAGEADAPKSAAEVMPVAVEELPPPPVTAEPANATNDMPRAGPEIPRTREVRRIKRPAPRPQPIATEESPVTEAAAQGVGRDGQAAEEGQARPVEESRAAVALSALDWQPSLSSGRSAPPSYGGNPAPAYPAAARRRGLQGQVVVRAEVAADGRAARVEVKRSSGHALLDDAALAGVREWRFAPAEVDGVPSAGAIEVPITFKLVD